MRPLVLAATVLFVALAGCIGTPADDAADTQQDEDTLANVAAQIEQQHDHDDAREHDLAWNLERVGYHTGYEDPDNAPNEPASFSEGFRGFAVHGDHAYLCRGGEDSGVAIVDVSEPSEPTFAAHFSMPQCNDVVVGEEGRWVLAGTQRNPISDVPQESEAGPASAPRGAYLIDAEDPTNPTFESFHETPYNGVHTLTSYATDDGRQLFMVQSYDLYSTVDPTGQAPLPAPDGAAPVTHRTVVTELVEAPDGTHQLERVSTYSATGSTVENPEEQIIVHDAIVRENPVDGNRYLIVAYWDLGVHIVDFEDPSNPQLVGTYDDFSPSEYANIHRADAFPTLVDGKWVIVSEPEIAGADETGQLTFVDASDPENPTKLGHWTLPGDLKITEPYLFSPHNFRTTEDGRVYLGHFHAGVWGISVDGPGSLEEPATIAGYEPTAPQAPPPGGPMTWGVELQDGLVYAIDSPTGLHVLEPTAS